MMKNCNKLVKMISIALIVCFFCCNLQVSGFAAQNNDNSNNIVKAPAFFIARLDTLKECAKITAEIR